MTHQGRQLASVQFPALGTTASLLVVDRRGLDAATAQLRHALDELDRACSRFRPDSELHFLNRAGGSELTVSPLLLEAVSVALRAARVTDGLVDPTVGQALRAAGYDVDFAEVPTNADPLTLKLRPVPGWRVVQVDPVRSTIRVPAGVELDVGATAKAWCADRTAASIARAVGSGVLVNLGGDVAVAGAPPEGGWSVRIADRHDAPPGAPGQTVVITEGGLATSGVAARRWRRGGQPWHHIIDPRAAAPARVVWRTVSVAAASCLDANIASTAAIILGREAPGWLAGRRLPARLVRLDGQVCTVGGWPVDPEAATCSA